MSIDEESQSGCLNNSQSARPHEMLMLLPGPFELLILLFFGGGLLYVLSRVFGGRSMSRNADGGGISLGHATLKCPHCQEETRAGDPVCEKCGREL